MLKVITFHRILKGRIVQIQFQDRIQHFTHPVLYVMSKKQHEIMPTRTCREKLTLYIVSYHNYSCNSTLPKTIYH